MQSMPHLVDATKQLQSSLASHKSEYKQGIEGCNVWQCCRTLCMCTYLDHFALIEGVHRGDAIGPTLLCST